MKGEKMDNKIQRKSSRSKETLKQQEPTVKNRRKLTVTSGTPKTKDASPVKQSSSSNCNRKIPLKNRNRTPKANNTPTPERMQNLGLHHCSHCTGFFCNKFLLDRHILQAHTKCYKCDKCVSWFPEETQLNEHKLKAHNDLPLKVQIKMDPIKAECSHCKKFFFSLKELLAHKQVNGCKDSKVEYKMPWNPPKKEILFSGQGIVKNLQVVKKKEKKHFQSVLPVVNAVPSSSSKQCDRNIVTIDDKDVSKNKAAFISPPAAKKMDKDSRYLPHTERPDIQPQQPHVFGQLSSIPTLDGMLLDMQAFKRNEAPNKDYDPNFFLRMDRYKPESSAFHTYTLDSDQDSE